MSEKYKGLKTKELQELLVKKGLPQTGKQEEWIERLVQFDKRKELETMEKELELDVFEQDKSYPSLDLMKESVLSDDEDLLLEMDPKPKSSLKREREGEEKRASDMADSTGDMADSSQPALFQFTPITFDKQKAKSTSTEEQARLDAQRRLERMKRFGVKVNDEEMKALRAARFGTETAQEKVPTTGKKPKSNEKKPIERALHKIQQKKTQWNTSLHTPIARKARLQPRKAHLDLKSPSIPTRHVQIHHPPVQQVNRKFKQRRRHNKTH